MMKSAKIAIILCAAFALVLADVNMGIAQSDTEEARERLRGNSRASGGSSTASFFVEAIGSFRTFAHLLYFTDIEHKSPPKPGYSAIPFSPVNEVRGLVQYESGKKVMAEVSANLAQFDGIGNSTIRNFDGRLYAGYWVFEGGYEYLRESGAPFGISQYNLNAGRKLRLIPSADAHIFLGYRSLGMAGERFDMFDTGLHLRLFLFDPLSISYTGTASFAKYTSVYNHTIDLGVNFNQFTVNIGWRNLDIGGVTFNGFTTGVGFRF